MGLESVVVEEVQKDNELVIDREKVSFFIFNYYALIDLAA